MELSEFLLARIAEDEEVARAADVELDPRYPDIPWLADWSSDPDAIRGDEPWAFLGRITPRRVLAECEAKRRIVALWRASREAAPSGPWLVRPMSAAHLHGCEDGLYGALQALALPYADHPHYREEWKP